LQKRIGGGPLSRSLGRVAASHWGRMRTTSSCCCTEDWRIPALGIGGDGTTFPAPACSLTTPSRSRARQPSYLTCANPVSVF
jgi:hypothetical protein